MERPTGTGQCDDRDTGPPTRQRQHPPPSLDAILSWDLWLPELSMGAFPFRGSWSGNMSVSVSKVCPSTSRHRSGAVSQSVAFSLEGVVGTVFMRLQSLLV